MFSIRGTTTATDISTVWKRKPLELGTESRYCHTKRQYKSLTWKMGFRNTSSSPVSPVPVNSIMVLLQIEHAVPVIMAAMKIRYSAKPHFVFALSPPPIFSGLLLNTIKGRSYANVMICQGKICGWKRSTELLLLLLSFWVLVVWWSSFVFADGPLTVIKGPMTNWRG